MYAEVNRILRALKLEDIRKHGIEKLPEELYKKSQACFLNDVTDTESVIKLTANDWASQKTSRNLFKEKEEGITNLCGYASYYLAEQWDYDSLENKESLLKIFNSIYFIIPFQEEINFKDVRIRSVLYPWGVC